jgi:alpha-aminoadipic semialdehyde synthase
VVHVSPSDYLYKHDGSNYDREAYYARPNDFHSCFYETVSSQIHAIIILQRSNSPTFRQVAPYISLLVNGVGWKPGFPRLMSNDQLAVALRNAREVGKGRFRSVADVTCDPTVS